MIIRIARKMKSLLFRKQKYELIILPEYQNLKFRVYNNIEKYRIQDYGSEEEALKYFVNLVRIKDVVYDIGASVGLVTLTSALKSKKGLVISFEPDSETFTRLNENIRFNKLKNIKTINMALSDQEGILELYTNGTNGYSPSLRYQKIWDGKKVSKIQINTTSIDTLIEREDIPVADIMKIDIEGAEMMCLLGASKLLGGYFGKRPRDIFLEAHPEYLPAFNSSEPEIVEFVESNGYTLIKRTSSHNQVHLHFNK